MLLSKVFNTSKGRHIWPTRTICEVHREIYDALVVAEQKKDWKLVEAVIPLLDEAYEDGVKMTKKLVDYKISLPEFETNTPSIEKIRLRQLRKHLEDELKLKLALVYDPNDYKLSAWAYSKCYRDMFDALQERFSTTLVTKSCDVDADVVIYFDPHSCNTLVVNGGKLTYEYFNDPHQKDSYGQYIHGQKFHKVGPEGRARRAEKRGTDFIICPSVTGYEKYLKPLLGDKLVFFPVAPKKPEFNVSALKDRKRVVIGSGHTWNGNKEFNPYQFRNWVYSQKYIARIGHAKDDPKVPIGQEYIKLLSHYVGAISACDVYVVAKYLENSLAGCVNLMQHQHECDQLGFKHGINCMMINTDNLKKTVRDVVNNQEKFQDIADQGRLLVESRWTAGHFADYIHNHARSHL